MGVLTSGLISVRPFRVNYSGNLEGLLEELSQSKYPIGPDLPSSGFGSLQDQPAIVGGRSDLSFRPGNPVIENGGGESPRRLRVRYYYDVENRGLQKLLGTSSDWRQTHTRSAFDMTVYENSGEKGTTVLVSARDDVTTRKPVAAAISSLFPSDGGAISFDKDVPEAVDSDFFLWILWRFEKTQLLAPDVAINWVDEIASKDGMKRGARFTDDAAYGRVDLSSLIAHGTANFGPAKLDIRDNTLDANFSMEVHFDGGFVVYRSSQYSNFLVPSEDLGSKLTDDLWLNVLPKIREAYNSDTLWTSEGREELKNLATEKLRLMLGITCDCYA